MVGNSANMTLLTILATSAIQMDPVDYKTPLNHGKTTFFYTCQWSITKKIVMDYDGLGWIMDDELFLVLLISGTIDRILGSC